MAKAPTEIRSLARAHTDTALKVLASIMSQGEAPHSARVQAAQALLDRGWGKPAQAIVGGGEDDPGIKLIHEIRRTIVENAEHSDSKSIPTVT